jgi:hypothetical protein
MYFCTLWPNLPAEMEDLYLHPLDVIHVGPFPPTPTHFHFVAEMRLLLFLEFCITVSHPLEFAKAHIISYFTIPGRSQPASQITQESPN